MILHTQCKIQNSLIPAIFQFKIKTPLIKISNIREQLGIFNINDKLMQSIHIIKQSPPPRLSVCLSAGDKLENY